jgi:hypothetical protein
VIPVSEIATVFYASVIFLGGFERLALADSEAVHPECLAYPARQ